MAHYSERIEKNVPAPVKSKREMYARLAAGEFGNTMPFWTDIDAWWHAPKQGAVEFGVRSMVKAQDPRTRVYVPLADVQREIAANWGPGEYQITPMVDAWRTGCFNVAEADGILYVEGKLFPPPRVAWRDLMLAPDAWRGPAGRLVLKSVMNDNDYDDLAALLDLYPEHVVELTTLNRCMGTIPGRCAVVWEVRQNY